MPTEYWSQICVFFLQMSWCSWPAVMRRMCQDSPASKTQMTAPQLRLTPTASHTTFYQPCQVTPSVRNRCSHFYDARFFSHCIPSRQHHSCEQFNALPIPTLVQFPLQDLRHATLLTGTSSGTFHLISPLSRHVSTANRPFRTWFFLCSSPALSHSCSKTLTILYLSL